MSDFTPFSNPVSCNSCKALLSNKSVIDYYNVKIGKEDYNISCRSICGVCKSILRTTSTTVSNVCSVVNLTHTISGINTVKVYSNGADCVIPKHNIDRSIFLQCFEPKLNFITPTVETLSILHVFYNCSQCDIVLCDYYNSASVRPNPINFKLRVQVIATHKLEHFWLEEWNKIVRFGEASVAIP